jgi:hypothetical protein
MVIDSNRLDVLQAASIFYDDWLRRAVNDANHHNLVLLPDDAAKVAALIDQAGTRVELYTSYLADPGVISSLRSARARGAVVRVLTPPASNNAGLLLAARAGQVRFRDDGAGTVLVIDRQTVLLGSMDLTSSTLSAHRDLGIVLSGRSAATPVDAFFFSEFVRGSALVLAPPRPVQRSHTVVVGTLKATVTVSPLVHAGGEGVIAVSTAAGATVEVNITYPAGSKPAAGTTGAHGRAGRRGNFVYRWLVAGRVKPGVARVLVVVHGRRTVARYSTSFVVAG